MSQRLFHNSAVSPKQLIFITGTLAFPGTLFNDNTFFRHFFQYRSSFIITFFFNRKKRWKEKRIFETIAWIWMLFFLTLLTDRCRPNEYFQTNMEFVLSTINFTLRFHKIQDLLLITIVLGFSQVIPFSFPFPWWLRNSQTIFLTK